MKKRKIINIFILLMLALGVIGLSIPNSYAYDEDVDPTIYDGLSEDLIWREDTVQERLNVKAKILEAIDEHISGYSIANESKNFIIFKASMSGDSVFDVSGNVYLILNIGSDTSFGSGITASTKSINEFQLYHYDSSVNAPVPYVNRLMGPNASKDNYIAIANEAFVVFEDLYIKSNYTETTHTFIDAQVNAMGFNLFSYSFGSNGFKYDVMNLNEFLEYNNPDDEGKKMFRDNPILRSSTTFDLKGAFTNSITFDTYLIGTLKSDETETKEVRKNIKFTNPINQNYIYYADEDIFYDDNRTLYFPGLEKDKGLILSYSEAYYVESEEKMYIKLDFKSSNNKTYQFGDVRFTIDNIMYRFKRGDKNLTVLSEGVNHVSVLAKLDGLEMQAGKRYTVVLESIETIETASSARVRNYFSGNFTSTVITLKDETDLPINNSENGRKGILDSIIDKFVLEGMEENKAVKIVYSVVSAGIGLVIFTTAFKWLKKLFRWLFK